MSDYVVSVVEDLPDCPECAVGKHDACNDWAWDNEKDEEVMCRCFLLAHQR